VVNVHKSQEKRLEAEGYVRLLIPSQNDRIEMVDPKVHCLEPTQGEQCLLNKYHGGYHSVSVFCCDGCGKMRRLPWTSSGEDVVFCFFCDREWKAERGRAWGI
jgi:hypothetical protein